MCEVGRRGSILVHSTVVLQQCYQYYIIYSTQYTVHMSNVVGT